MHAIDVQVANGSYFDHTLGWWRNKDKSNVLVLFYEDLKTDFKTQLIKLATFLNLGDKLVENNGQLMDNVVKKSSFEHMHSTTNEMLRKKTSKERGVPESDVKLKLVRKGVIGDYKNHFTKEESDRIDKVTKEKFKGTELEHYWDKFYD